MKKINFLIKLFNKKKLGFVDPSDEIKDSYIEKSESNLISSKILLKNNRLEESVSLAYYSMYHMLTALLFKAGIKCENHSASIILLKEIFAISNADISFAKKERIDKQYYTDFVVSKQDVIELIEIAEVFNEKLLNVISKFGSDEIRACRDRLKALL